MFARLHHRAGHYALLLLTATAVCLPNLGGPSLWDIDEGNNAEAAREMRDADNWVVPTFNYALRVDKPALLYWLQIAAYEAFGVHEFAARLPSAVAALLAVLLTYELGRRLFSALAGLLGGLVLATAVMFCAAGRFANPDALLNACTLLTFLCFWAGVERGGRWWFVPAGASMGLAVLSKGPVGLALPCAVMSLFLLVSGQWRRLLDPRLGLGILAFLLVAGPWYVWVGVETKATFLRGFWLTHNVNRFLSPMENHAGPVYYYVLVLLGGLAPWSVLLGPTCWYSVQEWHSARAGGSSGRESQAMVFLWCWIGVYFLFFSFSRTKLPNYVLPVAPALALLTARFLDRWHSGVIQPARWVIHLALTCLALLGIGLAIGLLVAGGVLSAPVLKGRPLPGVERWAILGVIPVLGAAAAWRCFARQERGRLVAVLAGTAVLFTGALAAWGAGAVERHKAPRALVEAHDLAQPEQEIRVGCHRYFQPSLVFYCRREVQRFENEEDVLDFLACPLPSYLFVPANVWAQLELQSPGSCRVLGQQRDVFRNCDVVVVTNR